MSKLGIFTTAVTAFGFFSLFRKYVSKQKTIVENVQKVETLVIELSGHIGRNSDINLKALQLDFSKLITDDIKDIIFRIDSYGGELVEAYNIYSYLVRVQKDYPEIKFHIYGDNLLSGGYMIALAFEKIYVNPYGKFGSIGVIYELCDVNGFLKHWGLNNIEFSSGKLKIPIKNGEVDEENKEMLKMMLDENFEMFRKLMIDKR